jgi:RNA polymerase sigma-70 factor (ECF subfamily)
VTTSDRLIDGFRAGDPDAVRAVYREYSGAVLTVARSIVHDRELAHDVVQQTFTKAWRSIATFDGSRSFAPWLYSIARNTAIDTLRAENKPTRGGHEPETDVAVEGPSLERTWERYEIRRALDTLSPDEREVVRRSHLVGETHEQIAAELGVPVGTVKSRSARAHRRLAAALAHLAPNRPGAGHVLQAEDQPTEHPA